MAFFISIGCMRQHPDYSTTMMMSHIQRSTKGFAMPLTLAAQCEALRLSDSLNWPDTY